MNLKCQCQQEAPTRRFSCFPTDVQAFIVNQSSDLHCCLEGKINSCEHYQIVGPVASRCGWEQAWLVVRGCWCVLVITGPQTPRSCHYLLHIWNHRWSHDSRLLLTHTRVKPHTRYLDRWLFSSSGNPKGAMLTHGNIISNTAAFLKMTEVKQQQHKTAEHNFVF